MRHPPKLVNIHQAKTDLSRLISEAVAGEKIIIARAGKPEVKLVPVRRSSGARKPGSAKGSIRINPDFDDPLPPQVSEAFEP